MRKKGTSKLPVQKYSLSEQFHDFLLKQIILKFDTFSEADNCWAMISSAMIK